MGNAGEEKVTAMSSLSLGHLEKECVCVNQLFMLIFSSILVEWELYMDFELHGGSSVPNPSIVDRKIVLSCKQTNHPDFPQQSQQNTFLHAEKEGEQIDPKQGSFWLHHFWS